MCIIDIYKDLLESSNIEEILGKYICNSEHGLYYDFGSTLIPKGTKLYRIRSYHENTDYSNPKEWAPSPSRKQNRCNSEGEEAIYLANNEILCILETYIQKGDTYVLGEYVTIEDIKVGGFIYFPFNNESSWKWYVGMILNMFLIAPCRNEKNKNLFELLDSAYDDQDFSKIRLEDIRAKNNMEVSFRIGKIVQKNFYKITNKLCSILKRHTPEGIRYSSCYVPIETVGITFSAYNLVLYSSGISKIKFSNYVIKSLDTDISAEKLDELLIKNNKIREKK